MFAAGCWAFIVSADADDAKHELHISEAHIGPALSELARQTRVQLLYPYVLAQVPGAHPVDGRYTVSEALDVMLKGTGFSGGLTPQGVIRISLQRTGCAEEGKAMLKTSQQAKTTVSAIALFLGVASAPACYAQADADQQGSEAMETVVVTGLRSSLNAAEKIKRTNYNVVDAIVPEDIGKLPDSTVGDALQRISGVQVVHSNDQVTGVNIRGFLLRNRSHL